MEWCVFAADGMAFEVPVTPVTGIILAGDHWRLDGQEGEWRLDSGVRTSRHPENRELPQGPICVFRPGSEEGERTARELMEDLSRGVVPAP